MPENNNKNYIVNEDLGELRYLSAMHMKNTVAQFMVGIIMLYMFTNLVPDVLGFFMPKSYFSVIPTEIDPKLLKKFVVDYPFASFVYTIAFGGMFTLGRSLYMLRYLRNKECDYPSILDGARHIFSTTLLFIVQLAIIAAFATLFVVPGVYAFYTYRQSFLIMAEDPSKGVFKCLAESRRLMAGNRMRQFQLDFTYIPLIIIANVPAILFGYVGMPDLGMYTNLIVILIRFILQIPVFYAMGNLFFGQAVFYELMVSKGFSNFIYKGEDVFRAGVRARLQDRE